MRQRVRSLVAVGVALAAVALVVHAALEGGEPAGKSGAGAATTLTLAMPDEADSSAAHIANRFAARVDSLSRGALHVSVSPWPVRLEPGTPTTRIEESAVSALRAGDVQLGLVPSHALAVGAPGLRLLQAPFLVSSYRAASRLTTGVVAERLQAGLSGLSLTGLTLVPEGLYRPFGYLAPLEAPGDFTGTRIRASRATEEILRALGARPVDLEAGEGDTAVYSGFVRGAESSLTPGRAFPTDSVTAGNVVLAPKVDLLVAANDSLARLTGRERAILRRAAHDARARTIATTSERAAAAAFCRAGGTVVTAPPAAVRALRAKTAPLLAELRRDPETRALLASLQRVAAAGPTPTLPTCAPSTSSSVASGSRESTRAQRSLLPPSGSYRRAFTASELRRAGADETEASANVGVTTFTVYGPLYDLHFAFEWPGSGRRPCRGRLEIGAARLTELLWNLGTPCSGQVAFRWRRDAGDLVLTKVEGDAGWITRVYPGTWKRVDCTPWIGWPGVEPAQTRAPPCGGGRTPSPQGVTGELAYSPDGERVVYEQVTDDGDVLVIANVDGSGAKSLLHEPPPRGRCPCDGSPAFSPQGTRVAFLRSLDDGRRAWFLVHVDGSGLRRLTPWSRTPPDRVDWSSAAER